MSSIKIISDEEFIANIEQGHDVALVDFYADWCGPCKVIAPIIEEIAPDYAGKMKFYKIDVDKHNQAAEKYGVRGIPTLIIFGDGQMKDTLVGAVSKDNLIKFIEKNL